MINGKLLPKDKNFYYIFSSKKENDNPDQRLYVWFYAKDILKVSENEISWTQADSPLIR